MPVSPESEIGVAYGQGRAAADALQQPTTNPYSDATLLGKQQRGSWFQGYYDAIRDQNIRLLQAGLAFLNAGGVLVPADSAGLVLGVNGGSIGQVTAGNPDQVGFWTGPASNAFIIAEEADKNFDFGHPVQPSPTLFIHSQTQNQTQWLSLTHNGTNAKIDCGAGKIQLGGNVNVTGVLMTVSGADSMLVSNKRIVIDPTTVIGWGVISGTVTDTALMRAALGVVKLTDDLNGTATRGFMGGGTAVASAAALPLPTGRVFHVTGGVNITSITSTNFQAGVVITLIFDGVLTLTDGGNLKLAGNFVTSVDATISLVFDGTNWFELGRSVN